MLLGPERTTGWIRFVVAITLFFSPVAISFGQGKEDKPLIIGTDPWCPYNCEDASKPGIVIDIFKEIFEPLGHRIKVSFFPWARAIKMIRDGKTTTFGSANPKDAKDLIYASVPTVDMRNTIFVRKDDLWSYQGLPSLEQGILGVIRNYNYGSVLDGYIANPKNKTKLAIVSGVDSLDRLLKMLSLGRVKYIIDDQFVTTYRAKAMNLEENIRIEKLVTKVPLYFGFSPKDPKAHYFVAKTNESLIRMRKDGSMQQIFDRYGMACYYCEASATPSLLQKVH